MTTVQSVSKIEKVQTDLLSGIAILNNHLIHQFSLLNLPINNNPESTKTIQSNIYTILEDQLNLVLLGLNKRGLYQDPIGILDNNHILSNRKELKNSHILPLLIKRLLITKEDTIMSRRKSTNSNNPNNHSIKTVSSDPTVTEEPKVPESVSTPTQVTEAIKQVEENTSETKQEETVKDFNYDFHKPYINRVTKLLGTMNGLVEADPEFIKNKDTMNDTIRSWVASFYKNIMSSAGEQVEGELYITKDVYNILDGENPFSDPEYFNYDNVHLVTGMFEQACKKFNVSSNTEVSLNTSCKTILDLQDDSKPIVEIQTNSESNESITVDKEKGTVEVKKDNIIVRGAKGVYNGFKSFCTNLIDLWKRLWNWCLSWFRTEEKIIISKEEYETLTGKPA